MFRKIMVPLDGSNLAEKALLYAKVLAGKFEAQIILVRVVPTSPDYPRNELYSKITKTFIPSNFFG